MKIKSKCIGCNSIKMVNSLTLCKRCNRHAHDFITKDDMDRLKLEREMRTAFKLEKKKTEEQKEKDKAEKGEGEGAEKEEKEEDKDEATGVADTKVKE